MEKIFRNPIFTFVLGLIVMCTIGTVAYSYTAKQVSFTPNDKSWKVSTVEEAINDLKSETNKNLSLYIASFSGKSTLSTNNLIKCKYKKFKIVNYYKSSSNVTCRVNLQDENTWTTTQNAYSFDQIYDIQNNARFEFQATSGQCDFIIYFYK